MTDDSSPATGITANPPSGELGRMLLERRVPISGAVTLGFMAIGMLAVGVVSASAISAIPGTRSNACSPFPSR